MYPVLQHDESKSGTNFFDLLYAARQAEIGMYETIDATNWRRMEIVMGKTLNEPANCRSCTNIKNAAHWTVSQATPNERANTEWNYRNTTIAVGQFVKPHTPPEAQAAMVKEWSRLKALHGPDKCKDPTCVVPIAASSSIIKKDINASRHHRDHMPDVPMPARPPPHGDGTDVPIRCFVAASSTGTKRELSPQCTLLDESRKAPHTPRAEANPQSECMAASSDAMPTENQVEDDAYDIHRLD